MWSIHHRHLWADLDAVEESTDIGRRLDVGGFVLADPFEVVLRNLSADYLHAAWQRLSLLLNQFRVRCDDLSWGGLHSGETGIPDLTNNTPINFVGWTSRQLAHFYDDPRYNQLDAILKDGTPLLRCAATWRSLKWSIPPDNYALALRLIEAWCTDEIAFWSPGVLLAGRSKPNEAWLQMAEAIGGNNQQYLDQAVAEAKARYSLIGYRIVIRGYAAYIDNWKDELSVRLPNISRGAK